MTGLRERKKAAARHAIAEVAMELFEQRGYDAVTYTDIAAAADVATKTVFNYFPTKEDLVLGSRRRLEQALLDAVAQREPGVSALSAVLDCTLVVLKELESLPKRRRERFHSVLTSSPTLTERLRSRTLETERTLAQHLAMESGAAPGDLRPALAASSLMALWHLAFFANGSCGATEAPGKPAEERIRDAARLLAEGLSTLGEEKSGRQSGQSGPPTI
ncbi:TetR/AcrR family transcriptional regulator [Dyella flagellata]|nr:TetR/AcrR family transcriptional regulator [Dyella flagellata]